jgi:outer membrane usher protein FimD/PapC
MQREGRLKYALTAGKYRSGNDDSDEPAFGFFFSCMVGTIWVNLSPHGTYHMDPEL